MSGIYWISLKYISIGQEFLPCLYVKMTWLLIHLLCLNVFRCVQCISYFCPQEI